MPSTLSNQSAIDTLRWLKFPALNDGFVTLVDVMGDDQSVVQAARVSYGNDVRDVDDFFCNHLDVALKLADEIGLPNEYSSFHLLSVEDRRHIFRERQDRLNKSDRDLIRYMMRHHHGTPFEMAEVKFLVRVPMDCWRQWIRHRTANVNEYSTRYSEAIDSQQTTPPDQWRLQSTVNKQGSSGFIPGCIEKTVNRGDVLSSIEQRFHEEARRVYQMRLDDGVAKEQARKDLPLSTYTEAYWKCDLRNIFHFLGLRMDAHAQLEIRQYATIIGEQIIKPLFPLCWEAFVDYQLGAMMLTRLEIEFLRGWMASYGDQPLELPDAVSQRFQNKREREECLTKLERLGLL